MVDFHRSGHIYISIPMYVHYVRMCAYKQKHIHYFTHKPLEHSCGPCRMKVVLDILQCNMNAKTCRSIIEKYITTYVCTNIRSYLIIL